MRQDPCVGPQRIEFKIDMLPVVVMNTLTKCKTVIRVALRYDTLRLRLLLYDLTGEEVFELVNRLRLVIFKQWGL